MIGNVGRFASFFFVLTIEQHNIFCSHEHPKCFFFCFFADGCTVQPNPFIIIMMNFFSHYCAIHSLFLFFYYYSKIMHFFFFQQPKKRLSIKQQQQQHHDTRQKQHDRTEKKLVQQDVYNRYTSVVL